MLNGSASLCKIPVLFGNGQQASQSLFLIRVIKRNAPG